MFRACFEVRKATTSAMSVDHQPRDSESHRSVFGSVLLASKQETVDPGRGGSSRQVGQVATGGVNCMQLKSDVKRLCQDLDRLTAYT
jgi:hypothetical protein